MSGFRIGDFKGKIDPALLNKDPAGPRADGRGADQLRPVKITTRFNKHAEGSVSSRSGIPGWCAR